jgi:hypothetical protein
MQPLLPLLANNLYNQRTTSKIGPGRSTRVLINILTSREDQIGGNFSPPNNFGQDAFAISEIIASKNLQTEVPCLHR